MKKKLIAAAMISAFFLAAGLAHAFTCEVVSVDGKEVKVKCDPADAKKLKVGKKVKVKK